MNKSINALVEVIKSELKATIFEALDERLNQLKPLTAPQTTPESEIRFISIQDVLRRFGVSRATLDRWLRPDSEFYIPDFPKKVKQGTLTFFVESEIDDYMKKVVENKQKQGGEQC